MADQRTDAPDLWRRTTSRDDPNLARNAPPWVLVAVPILLLAAVLGLAYLVRGSDPPRYPKAQVAPRASNRADDAVRAYLQALAAGDSATAISVSAPTPTGPFLTDDVLATQQRVAPLRDIVVSSHAGSGTRDDVDARYSFGARPVRTRIAVIKSHGQWRVQYGTVAVDVRYARKIPGLLLWGQPLATDVVRVFPGPTRFTLADPDLALINKDSTFATEPTVGWGAPFLDVELSAGGRSRAITAAVGMLRSCQAAVRLEPAGCPQRAFDYEALGTAVTWRLVGDPSRDLDVHFDGPTYGRVRVSGEVTWTVDYAARRFGGAADRKHAEVTSFLDGTFDLKAAQAAFALD
jgi:hypothetical protein